MRIDKNILKNLLPGLLPLFVFVIADEFWGSLPALYIAIIFGLGELGFSFVRFRKIEKFILLDLGLLVVLGLVSVLLKNDIFFKLKPAFIEVIFAALIGISVFSPKNLLLEMSKRYMKGARMTSGMEAKFNKNLEVVFYLTLAHIGLVVYSAFYMSKEAWAFISGVLFYIIILAYFGVEILRQRLRNKESENSEMLPVVDEDGIVIGKARRGDCHFNPSGKILHPVVHMHVINKKGEIYLQHRNVNKKVQPGKWDTAVGGHIAYGEGLEVSLKREAREEIGLEGFRATLIKKYIWETDVEKELVFMFSCEVVGELKVNTDEVSEGRFWKPEEIYKSLGKGIFTPNFEKEFMILRAEGKDFLRS
ncbi:MAG: NUDIX domain-containing protein [Bacteroidales bacterium]|nr:NUDIX domain-containing protein [Bacteroidales bacterium]